MNRPAFTRGSCWGWQGVVPYSATVRALDVTLEDDRPNLVTLVFEPIRESEDPALPPNESELEAILEWGSVQGAPHQALIDIGRGVVLGLSASRIIASVRNIGGGQQNPPPIKIRASASLGGASGEGAVQRVVRIGAIAAGNGFGPAMVPAFARRVSVARSPQETIAIGFRDGNGVELAQMMWPLGFDFVAAVPPGADRFVVANPSAADIAAVRVVFDLAL